MSLKADLTPLLRGEVYDDPQHLDAASRDSSLFEVRPKLVVAPMDSVDLQTVVRFINDHPERKLSITPRSAGTDMSGGPLTESIVIDMLPHFNKVLEVGKDFAITEPGVFYRDFEKETLKHKLLLPPYTASRQLNTVGGMVGNNSAGEKTLAYGKTDRYVKELNVVFADGNEYVVGPLSSKELDKKMAQSDFEGNVYKELFELIEANYEKIQEARPKVSKNSSGYYLWNVWNRETGIFDLTQLITGSQGTLGVVTKIKFDLIKPRTHSRMLVIFLKDLNGLGDLVNKVLEFHPESFESFDDHTLKFAIRFMPEMAKAMSGNLISLGLSFMPEALMLLKFGGLPKLMLMAEFTGTTDKEVIKAVNAAHAAIKPFGLNSLVTHSEQEGRKYWTIRRESFNLLRKHVRGLHSAPFIDDVAVLPSQLPQFLPELEQIMSHYKLIYTIAGHIGDANFHIIPLMDLKDPQTQVIVPKLSREVYDLVLRYGGTISGEHNDGLIRTPYVLDMFGHDIYNLFVKTKDIFDPNRIFNPGKKVRGNLKWALKHFVDDSHIKGDDKTGRWNIAKETVPAELARAK